MSDLPNTGNVRVKLGLRTYQARWQVVGDRVQVSCDLGADSAPLGPLRFAPATVAREKLIEMVKRAARPSSSSPG